MQQEIIEIYRGFEIKRYNVIQLRVCESIYEKIKPALDAGISIRKIIEVTSKPCECCKGTSAHCFNKDDQPIDVKRGILNKR